MADAQRWVVVSDDSGDKTIVGGPYMWDGEAEWQPPEAGDLLLESEALTDGYTYPRPEPQPEPDSDIN